MVDLKRPNRGGSALSQTDLFLQDGDQSLDPSAIRRLDTDLRPAAVQQDLTRSPVLNQVLSIRTHGDCFTVLSEIISQIEKY